MTLTSPTPIPTKDKAGLKGTDDRTAAPSVIPPKDNRDYLYILLIYVDSDKIGS